MSGTARVGVVTSWRATTRQMTPSSTTGHGCQGARLRCAIVAACACLWACADNAVADVLTYHGAADRSGHYIIPALTWDRARALRLDADFRARVSGHIYAQPLYWRPPDSNSRILLVATQNDVVQAIDATTGK